MLLRSTRRRRAEQQTHSITRRRDDRPFVICCFRYGLLSGITWSTWRRLVIIKVWPLGSPTILVITKSLPTGDWTAGNAANCGFARKEDAKCKGDREEWIEDNKYKSVWGTCDLLGFTWASADCRLCPPPPTTLRPTRPFEREEEEEEQWNEEGESVGPRCAQWTLRRPPKASLQRAVESEHPHDEQTASRSTSAPSLGTGAAHSSATQYVCVCACVSKTHAHQNVQKD